MALYLRTVLEVIARLGFVELASRISGQPRNLKDVCVCVCVQSG